MSGHPHHETQNQAALQNEIDTASLYRTLAEIEPQPELAEVYRRLAAAEERHVSVWQEKLRRAGQPIPSLAPSWRARTLAWMARRFGPQWVLPTLIAQEQNDVLRNRASPLGAESRTHSHILQAISQASRSGLEGSTVARLEGRHRMIGGNALRAAVLGVNDGLVSNLSLVMGVAGAEMQNAAILVAGFAGLLAGSCSMAMGEWLSVQSSRELYQQQIAIEAEELATSPDEEAEELTLIYQARGVPVEQARLLAQSLIRDETSALDTLSREELGIDPEELGGSAWEAAATSFILFCVGAIVPVIPFLLISGKMAILASLGLSSLCLFLIGAAITLLTGRGILASGVRQLLFGLAAAGVTYSVGRLLGVSLAG